MALRNTVRENDALGRKMGMVVFILGILVLLFTASVAHGFFNTNSITAPLPAGAGPAVSVTSRIADSAIRMVFQLGVLLVMTIVGSLIAGKGLQLYFSSTSPGTALREPPVGEELKG